MIPFLFAATATTLMIGKSLGTSPAIVFGLSVALLAVAVRARNNNHVTETVSAK